MDEKKFFTVAETALTTGVAKRTLRRMIAAGQLPIVRFGRAVRVPVAVLDAMAQDAIDAAAAAAGDAASAEAS